MNGPLYRADLPCGLIPAQAAVYYSLEELSDYCVRIYHGRVEYSYNAYRLDADGNVVDGYIETETEIGNNSGDKIWAYGAGCYNAEGELTYGDDCDHCSWQWGRWGGTDDFDVTTIESTTRVNGAWECRDDEDPWMYADSVPQEDELI